MNVKPARILAVTYADGTVRYKPQVAAAVHATEDYVLVWEDIALIACDYIEEARQKIIAHRAAQVVSEEVAEYV